MHPLPRRHFERSEKSLFGVGGCNVFSNASPAPTRPARAPLLFHWPHQARSHLLRPCRLPRRCPPKIPRLRPSRLRRPLHRQNRNRNLSRLNEAPLAVPRPSAAWYGSRPDSYTVRCLSFRILDIGHCNNSSKRQPTPAHHSGSDSS